MPYRACGRCGGLWLSRENLTRLELRAPKGSGPPAIPAPAPSNVPEEAARCICPGRPLMALVDRYGVTVDVCPSCGGVWLDPGEIDRILQCYAERGIAQRATRPPGPAYEGPAGTVGNVGGAAAVADLGFGALDFLLDFLAGV